MSNVIIGCDNGISGALVALSSHNGAFIGALPMQTKKLGGLNVIDGADVVSWIRHISAARIEKIAIEACPEHANKAGIMRSMGISFGILYGAISTGLPNARIVTVRSGNPKDSWQRAMLGKLAKGDTKRAALEKARELWPDETFLATKRSKVPNSGIVDAALIGYYAFRNNL